MVGILTGTQVSSEGRGCTQEVPSAVLVSSQTFEQMATWRA